MESSSRTVEAARGLPDVQNYMPGMYEIGAEYKNNYFRFIRNSILIYKPIVLFMELTQTLKTFIEEGQDWERKNTSVKGVSIIRLPATRNRPASLAIDINPVGENGLPMKKKGIMIMNAAELAAFRLAFTNEKVDSLIAALEEVLPERKAAGKSSKMDVVQI
jgi:hypothetical protein